MGTNPPATLADPRLAYTNGTLTYTPATNQFLGTNGQTVTATLAYSDTLGHRATNTWPFKLELTPILASNVVLITASSPLTLASTNGDTYVFNYTGASSGLTNGHILVSTDATFPYKRTVLSVTDNPGTHTVSLVTTQAALVEILSCGSVRFAAEELDTDGVTIPLGGMTLYDQNNVTVEVLSGRLFFDPDFSISAELCSPQTFDLDITASVAFDINLRAMWQDAWTFMASQPIGEPLHQLRLRGVIPTPIPIPVSAEAVWEFNIGTEGEVTGMASATAGFESTLDLAFGARLRNGQWKPYARETSRAVPNSVSWEGNGSGRIRGYVEPKLSIYLENQAGPTANLKPYLELEGKSCVEPGQFGTDVSLYAGLNGTLAVDVGAWNKNWGALPSWDLFNVRRLIWHKNQAVPNGPTPHTIPNMVWIPCGTFTMGSPDSEAYRGGSEGPQTRVTISRGGRYEVTQGEYLAIMGTNPSYFDGVLHHFNCPYSYSTNLPVETVSWSDAVAYCTNLTQRESLVGRLPDGYAYRLPTDAEWEYACRAGTTTAFHYGPAFRCGMANVSTWPESESGCSYYCIEYDSSVGLIGLDNDLEGALHVLGRRQSSPVGRFAPNAWGLYDMHGNVWEWCSDWWLSSLPGGSVTDPRGAATGSSHALRGGGCYDHTPIFCRSAARRAGDQGPRDFMIGFRVVLAPVQP